MSTLASNKKAFHDYNLHETYEAGIVLQGHEVKSVRAGSMSIKGAFVVLTASKKLPELSLINAHIPRYKMSAITSAYDPERSRKLLLNRREIRALIGKIQQKGLTMVPIKVYTRGRRIKVEFALASGKKKYDKRESIKKREIEKTFRKRMKDHR